MPFKNFQSINNLFGLIRIKLTDNELLNTNKILTFLTAICVKSIPLIEKLACKVSIDPSLLLSLS